MNGFDLSEFTRCFQISFFEMKLTCMLFANWKHQRQCIGVVVPVTPSVKEGDYSFSKLRFIVQILYGSSFEITFMSILSLKRSFLNIQKLKCGFLLRWMCGVYPKS